MTAKRKYILQYGSLAGWPFLLAENLRAAGYDSQNVIPATGDFLQLDRRLPHDRSLSLGKPRKVVSIARRTRFFLEAVREVSLIHYHSGVILPTRLHPSVEGRIAQACDIPMVMSFGGGEARIISQARQLTPYFYLKPDAARDAWTHNYLSTISKRIRFAATDPEMFAFVKPYFEKTFLMRQPVNLTQFNFVEPNIDRPVVFLHIPTHPWAKGTDYFVAAAERLKSEGYKLEFRLVQNLPQAEMYQQIADADVYLDELLCGGHGVTAVEAMAAGKPTVTYIRPDAAEGYPAELPLVNANPDTIYDQMRMLICEPGLRRELAYAGRRYAEKYHDATVVAQDMLSIYREIGWTAPPQG